MVDIIRKHRIINVLISVWMDIIIIMGCVVCVLLHVRHVYLLLSVIHVRLGIIIYLLLPVMLDV